MKWIAVSFVLAACSNADGTRGQCAEGGALEDCPEAERTPEGACWRLVDCGAIDLKTGNGNFDWSACVDGGDNAEGFRGIDRLTSDRQRLVIDCIAASTCDSLRVDGSPGNPDLGSMTCLLLGDQ